MQTEVNPHLTPEAVAERRAAAERAASNRVMFRVSALYGISPEGMRMPLSKTESIESGQIAVSMDPDASPGGNTGYIDFNERRLKVRYAAQLIFPKLYELVQSQKHEASLLRPVRVVATDDCNVNEQFTGWHALGCLDFLPGSVWSGAAGG